METVWVTPAVHKSVLLNSDTDRLEKRIIPQNQDVPLVEFMHCGLYNLFIAPGEHGTKGEWSLSCSNCVMSFERQLTFLVCWSYTNTTGLVLFQLLCQPFKLINFATGDRSVHISMVYNLTTRKNSGGLHLLILNKDYGPRSVSDLVWAFKLINFATETEEYTHECSTTSAWRRTQWGLHLLILHKLYGPCSVSDPFWVL